MARQESDREDLIREATALVERIEIRQPGNSFETVIGFKRTGGLSIYFGADPVYQFDSTGAFRRGYLNGCLLRTQGTTIAELTRQRTETESHLLRRDMESGELAQVRENALAQLRRLARQLEAGEPEVLRSVTDDEDRLVLQIAQFVNTVISEDFRLAQVIKGRR